MDTEHKARPTVPLSPRLYDGTPVGTLPAQRGRENAGIGLQDGGSRGDRTQAKDARPAGGFSFRVYRRRCQNQDRSEPGACESCDCTGWLERKLVKLGEPDICHSESVSATS